LARDLSSPVTKVSRSPKARFDREHVETFLDSHSREKNVYKSEMELLLKVKNKPRMIEKKKKSM
jgi:hypothetical protein